MGEYRSDGEGLTGIARELVSAYLDAPTDCDAEYAAEEIDEFLLDRDWLPGEALVVLLDLPLRAQTSPLLRKATDALSARGAEVVGLLLATVMSDVPPRGGHAAEIMGHMEQRELIAGALQVLAGRSGDGLKSAAVAALVAIGEPAMHPLERLLPDPFAGPWARDAVDELRGIRTVAAQMEIEALESAFAAEAGGPAARCDGDQAGAEDEDDGRR